MEWLIKERVHPLSINTISDELGMARTEIGRMSWLGFKEGLKEGEGKEEEANARGVRLVEMS